MKTVLSITSAATIAVVLSIGASSCLNRKTVIQTATDTFEQHLPEVDSAEISVEHTIEYYESFKGGRNLCNEINNTIVKICYGDEYDGQSIENANRAAVDELWSEYQKDAGDDYKQYIQMNEADKSIPLTLVNWEYVTTGSFGEDFKGLQTYNVLSYVYQGGAHGMQTYVPYIISLKTGEQVAERDLFKDGYQTPVADLIKSSLQKEYGEDTSAAFNYSTMYEEGMVPNGTCGVSEKGVFWRYQPYEIACYAAGVIEATVAWNELKDYLNPAVISVK